MGKLENTIIHCSAYDLLSTIDDGVVGAVITEPPEEVEDGKWTIREIARILRPGGGLVLIGGGKSLRLWERLAPKANLHLMAEIIVLWDSGKPRTRNFGSIHSNVLWFAMGGHRHTFNFDTGPNQQVFSNVIVSKRIPIEERVHPSEKPVGVTNFLVSLLTNEGDLVVDPYCGSGSTMVSAVQCGRRWLGADTDEWHVRTAVRRVGRGEEEEIGPVFLWINGVQHEI